VGKTVRAASAEFTPVDKHPVTGLVEAGSKQQNVPWVYSKYASAMNNLCKFCFAQHLT
jgi:hypothetical protein